MSFLGGGPECSTAGNPLSQFAKHTQDDRSLQRDRIRNGAPQGGMGGFRSAAQHGPQDEVSTSPILPGSTGELTTNALFAR
jgi:peroxin-5